MSAEVFRSRGSSECIKCCRDVHYQAHHRRGGNDSGGGVQVAAERID